MTDETKPDQLASLRDAGATVVGRFVEIEVQPLEVRMPLCSVCDEETSADDDGGFCCEPCGAYWEKPEDYPGIVEFVGEQCRAMLDAYQNKGWEQVRGRVFRCIREASHVETDDPVVHRGIRVDEGSPSITQVIHGRVWDWRDGASGGFFADEQQKAERAGQAGSD